MRTEGEDADLGGFGSEEDTILRQHKPSSGSSGVKSSVRRATGDRDERGEFLPVVHTPDISSKFACIGPLEKLVTLLEDVFEAEDALPPEVAPEDLPTEWFSPLSAPHSPPHLHPNLIRKLITQITKAARPGKRHRLGVRDVNANQGTPRFKGRIAEIDSSILSRILKMLERSIRAGEDLEPFPPSTGGPQKQVKGKKLNGKKGHGDVARGKSTTPGEGEADAMEVDEPGVEQHSVTERDIEGLTQTFELARDSVLAADCCIALLGSDRLPKQVW